MGIGIIGKGIDKINNFGAGGLLSLKGRFEERISALEKARGFDGPPSENEMYNGDKGFRAFKSPAEKEIWEFHFRLDRIENAGKPVPPRWELESPTVDGGNQTLVLRPAPTIAELEAGLEERIKELQAQCDKDPKGFKIMGVFGDKVKVAPDVPHEDNPLPAKIKPVIAKMATEL
jgi:hypothetical protein